MSTSGFTGRFGAYFDREPANLAAKSISDGAEIEIRVGEPGEIFTFTRMGGANRVVEGPAKSPDLIFKLSPKAAEAILADSSEDIGSIGVHIAKLVISSDAETRIHVEFRSGFLALWTRGYFGVLKSGGAAFAAFLASRGLSGLDGLKSILKKWKN